MTQPHNLQDVPTDFSLHRLQFSQEIYECRQQWNAQKSLDNDVRAVPPKFGPPMGMHEIPEETHVGDKNSVSLWIGDRLNETKTGLAPDSFFRNLGRRFYIKTQVFFAYSEQKRPQIVFGFP
jgi:hypothetical protein